MKRIYTKNAAYLTTTNPIHRYPFFDDDILVEVLISSVIESMSVKEGILLGYKINPDHMHLIIQVRTQFNISQIMQSVKRISSLRINQILSFGREDNPYANLEWTEHLIGLREHFLSKFESNIHEFPSFKWQAGFDDQIIRTPNNLNRTFDYLRIQHIKHGLKQNKWLFVINEVPSNIRFDY